MQKKREFFLHQRVVGFRAYHAYLQLHSYPTNLKGAGPATACGTHTTAAVKVHYPHSCEKGHKGSLWLF